VHPSLQHRYGLRTPGDVAIAQRMIATAKRAGWSEHQIESLLEFHGRELVPRFESGQLEGDAAMQMLFDQAVQLGVPEDAREALVEWHTSTVAYMQEHDGALPPQARGPVEEAASELKEIEQIMREDPRRYWSDEKLQHRMHDLLEATQAPPPAPAPGLSKEGRGRLTQLEGLMGDLRSEYWAGPQSQGLQAEYRNLVDMAGASGGGAASSPAAAGADQSGGASGAAT
jgi:hypothetical protein